MGFHGRIDAEEKACMQLTNRATHCAPTRRVFHGVCEAIYNKSLPFMQSRKKAVAMGMAGHWVRKFLFWTTFFTSQLQKMVQDLQTYSQASTQTDAPRGFLRKCFLPFSSFTDSAIGSRDTWNIVCSALAEGLRNGVAWNGNNRR